MPSYRPRSFQPIPCSGTTYLRLNTYTTHNPRTLRTLSPTRQIGIYCSHRVEWQYRSPPHMFSVCGMGHITRLCGRMKDTYTYTPHWVCRHRLDLVHLSLGPCTSELLPEECLCNCHGQCHASGERCRNTNRSENKIHFILPLRTRHESQMK